jgi:hypothetical protein
MNVPKHPIATYMKYLIEDCYEEDYNPYTYNVNSESYRYIYTFSEWYFRYRKYLKKGHNFYKLTPAVLCVGSER